MILYIEKQAYDYPLTAHIRGLFPRASVVMIDHYKNLFDKKLPSVWHEACYILAKMTGNALLPVPDSYGYPQPSYFIRTTLNCVYDCEYCYLKGMFRNDMPVIFVNDEEMMQSIRDALQEHEWMREWKIYFYPANYTDLLGFEKVTQFHQHFIPFFAQYPDIFVESRTKSDQVWPLLQIDPPDNVEIAWSLNPQEIIDAFEKATPSLEKRITAMQQLLDAGRLVGVRIMPLLPVENYRDIYSRFLDYLGSCIDLHRLHSIFVGWFLLTKDDMKKMQAKNPTSRLFSRLTVEDGTLMRMAPEIREDMYRLMQERLPMAKMSFE